MTDVDICNMAFLLIGDQVIVSLTAGNDRSNLANTLLPLKRDSLLREHPWKFATYRVALAADPTAPIYGWDYRFALPTSPYCLRVLGIGEDSPGTIPWTVEGRYILCNESTLKIKYVGRVRDYNAMDFMFADCLSIQLASSFAIALSKQKSIVDMCLELYKQKIQAAKSTNAMEGTQDNIENDQLIAVRG